jgi:hypothetical protein
MASLDSLPPDQRAVLQLVLQRGRTYDDIAQLLSIDRAAVRERALSALDALGPQTRVTADRRALITDYLLGQLPPKVADGTRDRLASSASERAWARVLASELAPLAGGKLPEIPAEGARAPTPEAGPAATTAAAASAAAGAPAPTPAPAPEPVEPADKQAGTRRIRPDYGAPSPEPARDRPGGSRTGGAILIGVGVLIVVVVVVVILATSGGGKKHQPAAVASTTTTSAATTSSTPTTSTGATPVAQFNLRSPSNPKTVGVVIVLQQAGKEGIAIRATNVPPNGKHDAYAVWLYNSPSDAQLLGFVSPGVTSNGQLSTAGALPSNASHFSQMLVTLETQAKPKQPGNVVLKGALKLH